MINKYDQLHWFMQYWFLYKYLESLEIPAVITESLIQVKRLMADISVNGLIGGYMRKIFTNNEWYNAEHLFALI